MSTVSLSADVYIQELNENDKLKETITEQQKEIQVVLKERREGDAENDDLKEENKILKEEIMCWKDVCSEFGDNPQEVYKYMAGGVSNEEHQELKQELDELKGRIEDAEHEASEWEDSYNELKEENKILKDKSKGFKTLFREVKKLRSSDKYLYKLLREEADSHGKTLNNMFEAFNLSEQNRKQARLHAESLTNAKSLEGHYRTLIGEWYTMCFKAQNKKLRKELEQKN